MAGILVDSSLLSLSSAEASDFPTPKGLAIDLWDHQRAALEYVVKARRVLIADEVGVGKTAVAIAAVQALKAFPALVVPPAYLRYKWQRDLNAWLPRAGVRVVEPSEPLILPGQPENPDFFIVSYNLVKPHLKALLRQPIRAFIADESHFLRNAKAIRTKACMRAAKGVPLRLILGASPIERSPRDLVSQLEVIDQMDGPTFKNGWNFQQTYCNRFGAWNEARCVKCDGKKCAYCRWTGQAFAKWDFSGANDLDDLNRRLRSTCYVRREKADVHRSLPPLTSTRIDLDISNRPEYDRAERDFMGWLESVAPEKLAAASRAEALSKVTHLKYLASVGKRPAAGQWIDDFLESNPAHKLVIFTDLRATAEYYATRYEAPRIVGGIPVKQRDETIQAFQSDAEPRTIVVGIEAGGVGIELHAASNCAFLEFDWLPTTHIQATGRLHRPGQKNPVTAWYLVARDTIEEDIFDLIASRERVVNAATQGGRAVASIPPSPRRGQVVDKLRLILRVAAA